MNFLEFAEKVIKEENKPLTDKKIWEIGQSKGYDKELNSEGKTPWKTIGARIYVDINNNKNSRFIKVLKPTRFFLKGLVYSENQPSQNIDNEEKKDSEQISYDERSLHKYLSYFVFTHKEQGIYTKTIYHEKSNKQDKYQEWMHPDIVGVDSIIENISDEVVDFTGIKPKLFSYEIKKELTSANLRVSFFQTVSNSLWANEAYLVAPEIDDDPEFQKELKRLSTTFGVGIIELDLDDPDNSKILFPSIQRENVNVETMDKLAESNPDFKDFLKRVNNDFKNKEIIKEKYDKIPNYDDIANRNGIGKSKKA